MSLPHKSVSTIKSPQFINLQPTDINPLISSCDIKVFYLGKNRNGSYITKDVATEMAKTLRGSPIVGYYNENKQDFMDHGEQVVINGEGVSFSCLTFPYGFVSPDADVWFQDFEDTDDFGNIQTRTYLMTKGFLWTGQYPQAQAVIDQGKPQSMELDAKSVQGKWSKDSKENIEYFIISDAVFSKLCILGDDVQPCFEGASITAPNDVSMSYSLDDNFKTTLFSMMKDLEKIVKGGTQKVDEKDKVINPAEANEQVETSFELNQEAPEETVNDSIEDTTFTENAETSPAEPETSFEKKEEEEKKPSEEDPDDENKEEDGEEEKEDDDEDKNKKYSLLESNYNQLKEKYDLLENEVVQLRQFKNQIEETEKDNLIKEFYMLSDEDKKDVIENKSKYSLSEIKAKLAVICFEKKVSFTDTNKEEKSVDNNKETIIFNVQHEDSTPDWVKAVQAVQNNKY